jgi:hypothetical protein
MADYTVSAEIGNKDDPEPELGKDGKPKKPNKKDRLKECLAANFGIVVDDPGNLDMLLAAVESSAASKQGGNGPKKPRSEGGKKDPIRTEPSTVLVMSQDANKKIADEVAAGRLTKEDADKLLKLAETLQLSLDIEKPVVPPPAPLAAVTPSPEMVQMSQTVNAMNAKLTEFTQKSYKDRIAVCLKQLQCSPDQAKLLNDRAATFQFAAGKESDPVLDGQLLMIEANKPGLLLSQGGTHQMAGGNLPKGIAAEPDNAFFRDTDVGSDEEIEKIVNGELAASGYIRPQMVSVGVGQ